MPPNSAKAADRKRGLAEADRNTAVSASSKPTKKRVKTATESVAKKQQPAALAHNPQTKLFHPYLPRIPRGPDGEFFVPQILPDECIDAVGKIPMPKSWMVGYDISPDRELTLGSRKWWEEHLPWLEKHKKALKLTPSKWKVRERLLAEQVFLPEDEGFRDWDIICYPIPNSENGEDHDQDAGAEPASSHESSEKGTAKSEADVVRKLASFHPNHKWIGSVRGYDRARWWMQEMLKRDQDEFSTYMYDDFSAYGKLEVLENMFMQFSKAIRSKTTYRDTWPEVEGLVMALHYGLGEFILCEDGGRCSDAMEMVGYLSITALNVLKDQGVLAPNSDIPNLGLILAVLLQWAWSWTDLLDWENIGWVYRVLDIVEEAGVAVGGTVGFPKVLEEMKKKAPRNGSDKRWKSFSWTGREVRTIRLRTSFPDNGVINVQLLLRVLLRLAKDYGAQAKQNTRVESIRPVETAHNDSHIWQVHTTQDGHRVVYMAKKIIITSGVYVNHVLTQSFGFSLDLGIWEMVASYFNSKAQPNGTIFPSTCCSAATEEG